VHDSNDLKIRGVYRFAYSFTQNGKLSGASVEILARLCALWAENAILPFRRTSVRVLLRGAWFDNSLFGPSK
jgi:hypothetical protein